MTLPTTADATDETLSARHLLRAATGELHAALDAMFTQTDFHERTSYAAFLTAQGAPLFALEDALQAGGIADLLPDWDERRRSAAIRHDLAVLCVTPPAPATCAPFTDQDRMAGAAYVLEGSRLGAKFLVRSARASRDPAVRDATAYLAHGEGVPMWPTFLKALAQRETAGLDRDALVAGARDAFMVFIESARATAAVEAPAARPTSG